MRPVRLRNYIFYLLALTITLPLLVLSYSQYRMIEQEIRKDDLLLVEDALALSNNIKNRVDSAKTLVVICKHTASLWDRGQISLTSHPKKHFDGSSVFLKHPLR